MENEGTAAATAPKLSESIAGWVESVIITTSQTSVGQALFKIIDSFLWVVEKSAQWSLPSHEVAAEENGKVFGKIQLVRPLPWILFLPGLVVLRIIRCSLNVGAFVLGYPRIEPSGMQTRLPYRTKHCRKMFIILNVKFVQKGRRRLRAMNLKAVKSARRKTCSKDKRLTMIEAKKALIRSIRLTLSTLSCLDTSKSSPSPPPTKIRISRMDLEPVSTPDEKSTTESAESPIHAEMKRKFSQVSSDEESTDESENERLQEKLERLAMDDSSDDPDFNAADCTTESSTASSENEEDKKVSLSELRDVQEDAKDLFKDSEEKPLIISLETLKTNSKKTEDAADGVKRGDSSETELQSTSKVTSDFINGEINSASKATPPPKVLPEAVPAPSPAPEVTNGVVCEKQSPKETTVPPAQSRASNPKENSSNFTERKGNKHKKGGRRDFK